MPPGNQQRMHYGRNFGRTIHSALNAPVEPHTSLTPGQDAEGLQNAAYHVGKPRPHPDQLSSGSKKRPRLMSFK
jgi:hypothetical protein